MSSSYSEMIDWTAVPVTEPPVTMDLTEMEILEIIGSPLLLPPFPCHTLNVERLVPVVTESALQRVGPENRNRLVLYYMNTHDFCSKPYYRWIIQTLKSREICGKFDPKKDDMSME